MGVGGGSRLGGLKIAAQPGNRITSGDTMPNFFNSFLYGIEVDGNLLSY